MVRGWRAVAAGMAAALVIAGPAWADPAPAALTLEAIQGWRAAGQRGGENAELGELRKNLLRETAQQVAAGAALAHETGLINAAFEHYARQLDHVYRFDQLTLHNGLVLPAVIKEANDMAALEQGTLRRVLRAFRIAQPEALLTRAPTWRDWLIQAYPYPDKPLDQLLPRDGAEQTLWREAAAAGWALGSEQAHEVARIRLARMQQAFVGMVRYHLLRACRMVTEPALVKQRRGVSRNGPELLIGEERYRIGQGTRFTSSKWQVLPQVPSLFDAVTGGDALPGGAAPP